MSMRAKSLKLFPEMKAYCNFVSPRWIVRIGDFTNREQAMEQLKKVRESGLSKEVRLVRCKVKMPVY
jgi:cell division septation protein DedD